MSLAIPIRNERESVWDAPIYAGAEAARLVGLSPSRVNRWLTGYEYTRSSGEYQSVRHSRSLVRRHVGEESSYASFLELVDLLFIKGFLDKGISLQRLRKALDEAADILGTHHFAQQTFFTSGKNVYLRVKEQGDAILELLSGGQWVIPTIIEQLSQRIDFDNATGLARRWYPRGPSGLVVLDPEVSFGRPRIANRGTTTANIYDLYLAEKLNIDRVCLWMGLERKEVEAAVEFEESLAA